VDNSIILRIAFLFKVNDDAAFIDLLRFMKGKG
jgi:hypothetical protein